MIVANAFSSAMRKGTATAEKRETSTPPATLHFWTLRMAVGVMNNIEIVKKQ